MDHREKDLIVSDGLYGLKKLKENNLRNRQMKKRHRICPVPFSFYAKSPVL